MYRILYNDSIIFDPYGNDNEVVSDASMSVKINAAAYMDFTMPRLHPLYNTIAERDGVVTLYWDKDILFQGTIESIDMDINGNKAVSCVSALDYLNDTVIRPYSTIAGEQELTAPSSVDGYFQWLIDQHNKHVKDSNKLFYIGVNQGANLQRNNFIYRSSTNNPTTASEISNQIIDSLGGYLLMRYEDGRHILDLYSDVHTMNAQIIDFGVNLKDFSKKIDTNDQYTALIAKGGSPQFMNGGFESGDFSYWESHPDTSIVTDKAQEGSYSSYVIEGVAKYVPASFFYAKKNGRYKSTVYVKNERPSNIVIHAGYQTNVLDSWSNDSKTVPFTIPNDDQWHECSYEFSTGVENNTKIRPYWYSDNISNSRNRRVYFDGFDFSRLIGNNTVSEDPIDLTLIPNGGTRYDSDIIKSEDVIYNPNRVSRYGYREKVFTDSTITNVEDLMQAAIKELNKLAEPTIGLDVKAIDLALYMDGYTHLNVGDAVRVRSAIHNTDEYLMVSSINLNLQDPANSEYVIGQAYDSLTGQQSGYLRSLSAGINSSLDAVASLDQTTKDQAIKIGSVTKATKKAQDTADSASSKADNAQQSADKAQQTANSNKEQISAVKDKQSEHDALIEQAKKDIAASEAEISGINDRMTQMDSDIDKAQSDIDVTRQEAQKNFDTANAAANAAQQRADTVAQDLEKARQEAQKNFDTANAAANAAQSKADSVGSDLESFRTETNTAVQNVRDSVSKTQTDVDAVTKKASDLSDDLDATKATVSQTVTEFGEVKTTATNAASKADQSLQVSTQASQTATSASQKATSAYNDAQTAITKSSEAVQTANSVSLSLKTDYQTKADADKKYATQSSLTATSDQIKSEVSKTYATQATVNALENIANNAVQTWMGTGAPTLTNKPASDWSTAALKTQHSGDIYYDTDTGYSYRFGSSDGSTYSWALIKDTDISKAIADAAKAQKTADSATSGVSELKSSIPVTYATKTELTQKADSITSRVEEVAQAGTTTSSKVTQLEQKTDEIKSTVSDQGSKLDNAVTTISQVSQKADSISTSLSQTNKNLNALSSNMIKNPGFETGDFTNWSYTDSSKVHQLYVNSGSQLAGTYKAVIWFPSTDKFILAANSMSVAKDHTYEISCWIWSDKNVTIRLGFQADAWDATNQLYLSGTTGWQRISTTWKFQRVYTMVVPRIVFPEPISDSFPVRLDNFEVRDITEGVEASGTANSALSKASSLEQNLDGFKTTVAQTYETKNDSLNKQSTLNQTINGFKTNVAQTYETKSDALKKQSSLTQTIDGFKTSVAQTYETKSDSLAAQSALTQTVNGFKTEVSQKYATNKSLAAISSNMLKNPGFETGGPEPWTIEDGMANVYVNNQNPHSGSYKLVITTPSTKSWSIRSNDILVVAGHTYEISMWTWADSAVTGKLGIYADGNWSTSEVNIPASSDWTRISVRRTLLASYSNAKISFGFSNAISASNNIRLDDFEIRDITEGVDAGNTANAAISKTSTLEQNLDGFKTTVAQSYETKNDALKKQSSLNQTIDGFKTSVAQTYETKNDSLSKQSALTQTIDGFKTDVAQTYETKNDSLNKKTALEQSLNGFKTTVSATYATKTSLNALSNQADVTYAMSVHSNAKNYWIRLGTATISEQGRITQLTLNVSKGSNGQPDQNAKVIIQIHRGWDGGDANHQFGVSVDNANWKEIQVKAFSNANNKVTIWVYNSVATYMRGNYTVSGWRNSWEDQGLTQTGAPAGTEQQVAMNVSLEDVNDIASSALTKSTTLEQRVDGITSTVSEQATKLDNTVTTVSQVSQKADSISSTVQQVQGDLNSLDFGGTNLVKLGYYFFNGSVTNTSYNKDQDLYAFTVPANLPTYTYGYGLIPRNKSYVYAGVPWGKCGILSFYMYADRACAINIDVNCYPMNASAGSGNDHDNISKREHSSYSIPANQWVQVWCRWENSNSTNSTGNPTEDDMYDTSPIGILSSSNAINVKIKQIKFEVGTKPTAWSPCPADVDANIGTAQGTANSALSKASTLEQTLDGFRTNVSQTYETKNDALSKQATLTQKQATLTQKVDSLRSEVSATYVPKDDFNNASSTTNMWPNQWFDTSKPLIGRAAVGDEIEPAPVGGNIRIIYGRDNYSSSVKSSVTPGRTYKISVDAKKISGTKSTISGGIWYTSQTSGNSWDGVTDFTSVHDYGNGWHRFERTITVPANKTRGTAWLQLSENNSSSTTAKWKISNLRFEDVTDIADIQANYSTKSYVDQTARTVSLGVVEEYKKGQHGSALATASDITAAKDSITSTVSQTYTTKSDFNNLQISGGRNIARDTKNFGNANVSSSDSGYLMGAIRTSGTYNGFAVRSLTSSDDIRQEIFNYVVHNVTPGEYYTMSFWAKGSGTMRLYCYGPSGYIRVHRTASSDGQAAANVDDGNTNMALSSDWKRYWVTWQLAPNPQSGYNTDKYFLLRNDNKMTSCHVCGVMIEKGNKASEWAPAPEDIETTYASKSEVKQTVDGLNVTISGLQSTANSAVTKANNAQSTADTANNKANNAQSTANSAVTKANNAQGSANTANSNAANAQNRVGNLETCIKMTTDGVRVGKIDNGNFSGYSALVNSAGSYDIMDGGSSVVARFNSSGIDMMNGNFWINGRPAIRNKLFDFYREFTSLDVPWRLWIKHVGNGMVWLRIAGTTNGNSVDQHGNIITDSLPYSFDPSPFIGAMHVAMIPVGVCIFNIVDKTLALNAGKWAGGKVSYDGSMILMCDV